MRRVVLPVTDASHVASTEQMYDCARNGLFVYDGGEALVTKSEIFNSSECNGCQVKGAGSKLAIHDSQVYNNMLSAIYCMNGGSLELIESQVSAAIHLCISTPYPTRHTYPPFIAPHMSWRGDSLPWDGTGIGEPKVPRRGGPRCWLHGEGGAESNI
jgi:hypothetical protein